MPWHTADAGWVVDRVTTDGASRLHVEADLHGEQEHVVLTLHRSDRDGYAIAAQVSPADAVRLAEQLLDAARVLVGR